MAYRDPPGTLPTLVGVLLLLVAGALFGLASGETWMAYLGAWACATGGATGLVVGALQWWSKGR